MECNCFSSSTLLNSTSIVKYCTICTLRRYYMSQFEREKLIWCILHNLGLFESQISCEFLGNTSLIEHQNNSIEHENSNCYIFATVPRSLSRYCRRQERKMPASPRCQGGSFPRSVVGPPPASLVLRRLPDEDMATGTCSQSLRCARK